MALVAATALFSAVVLIISNLHGRFGYRIIFEDMLILGERRKVHHYEPARTLRFVIRTAYSRQVNYSLSKATETYDHVLHFAPTHHHCELELETLV